MSEIADNNENLDPKVKAFIGAVRTIAEADEETRTIACSILAMSDDSTRTTEELTCFVNWFFTEITTPLCAIANVAAGHFAWRMLDNEVTFTVTPDGRIRAQNLIDEAEGRP